MTTRMLVLLLALLAGCQRAPASPELSAADIAAIRATTDRWEAAVRAGKWEDAAATFTEDAILRFADTVLEGRPAILKFHQSMPPWTPARTMHIDEIKGRGDMAFVMGHSTVTPDGGGEPVVVSRYLDIRLRQADGTWLFYRDMVNPLPPEFREPVKPN
jgi:uncharacterized protein (TIGR02246 family)